MTPEQRAALIGKYGKPGPRETSQGLIPLTEDEEAEVLLEWAANAEAAAAVAYIDQRRSAYAPLGEWLDALTKLGSSNETIRAQGQVQYDAIVAHNLKVKADNPKPV